LRTILSRAWQQLSPSWRWALGGVVLGRLVFGLWSWGVISLSPLAVQNLTLNNEPVVSAFNLVDSRAFIYQRSVLGQVLTFRPGGARTLVDTQTGTGWDVTTGRAIVGELAGKVLPPSTTPVGAIFPYAGVKPYPIGWVGIWQRFDANWYLKIAETGYAPDDHSTVFYPFYPLLIRLFSPITGNVYLSSLLVSTLALLPALFLFHRLALDYADPETANRALIYLLLFPVAFFLFAGYTESTCLALILAAFYSARRRRWFMAALFGFLAALTRGAGIVLVVPLVTMWWRQGAPRRWRDALALLFIPSGAGAFLMITNLGAFTSYQSTWHSRFVFPWEHFAEMARLIANHLATSTDYFNLFVTLLFGCLIVFTWLEMPPELSLYSALMFLLPLFRISAGQPFVSMSRYVLVLFPVFILLGKWGAKSWVNRLILYPSFLGALFFSAQFWMWGWVA
jgi:Mannosyltransferase (PIG-V)